MTEDFWNNTATAYALDHFLYFDEDHDIDTDEMEEWTPVDPLDLVELHTRGLLTVGEVFSHKGWHHMLTQRMDKLRATMWDGPTGAELFWRGDQDDNDWG